MSEKRKDFKGRILKDGESQRPDGRYCFKYKNISGKYAYVYAWKLTSTDKTPNGKREDICLRDKEKLIAENLRKGIDSAKAKTTLNELFEKSLEKKKKKGLKPSTENQYRGSYEKYVKPTIGGMYVKDIDSEVIISFYENLLINQGIKGRTVEIINSYLAGAFDIAKRNKKILENPTKDAIDEVKSEFDFSKKKRHSLSKAEEKAFINFVKTSATYNHWYNLFVCLLRTGCRLNELLALTIEDVDFTKRIIKIEKSFSYYKGNDKKTRLHILTPKSKTSIRTIPMYSDVAKAIKAELIRQTENGLNTTSIDGVQGFIFTNKRGSVYHQPSVFTAIDRITKAYNAQEEERAKKENREPLLLPHFSAHTFRHTFASRFAENCKNPKVLQQILGHSNINITFDVYTELDMQCLQTAFEETNEYMKLA